MNPALRFMRYLAVDLGAESGRVMLGTLEDGRISLEELSRFSNTPIRDGDAMYWNIPALLDGIREGLARAGALGQAITSVSADAWGVDYVLLDEAGEIMEPVFHYRHPRTAEGEKRVLAKSGLADVVRRERRAVHAAQHQHPAWLGGTGSPGQGPHGVDRCRCVQLPA